MKPKISKAEKEEILSCYYSNNMEVKALSSAMHSVSPGETSTGMSDTTNAMPHSLRQGFRRSRNAYAISSTRANNGLARTLKDALIQRKPKPGLILHSERGPAYRSFALIAYANKNGITLSHSRPGKPYDNSVCEAFFKTLKAEELYRCKCKEARDFIKSLADYIDFYNTKRPHEATRMMTPAEK